MSERSSEQKFICIMCPLGCEVTVKLDEKGEIRETVGAKCKKGEKYSAEELKNPTRILTSTAAIEDALHARLPVRTSAPVPKNKIFECMKEISKIKVKAPIKIGDKIIKNILKLNIDVIATRDL